MSFILLIPLGMNVDAIEITTKDTLNIINFYKLMHNLIQVN